MFKVRVVQLAAIRHVGKYTLGVLIETRQLLVFNGTQLGRGLKSWSDFSLSKGLWLWLRRLESVRTEINGLAQLVRELRGRYITVSLDNWKSPVGQDCRTSFTRDVLGRKCSKALSKLSSSTSDRTG